MKSLAALIWIIAVVGFLIGWIMNIVKIFGLWSEPVTTELIIRIVGVPVAILGGIAGWF